MTSCNILAAATRIAHSQLPSSHGTGLHKLAARTEAPLLYAYAWVAWTMCSGELTTTDVAERKLTAKKPTYDTIHDQLYAFRTARGTHNALRNLTSVLRSRANGHSTLAVFFDATKAYDSLPTELILSRLVEKGVQGRLLHFMDRLYAAPCSTHSPLAEGLRRGAPLPPPVCRLH